MRKLLTCLIGFIVLVGHLNAQTLEVPEKVKGLLLKTGAHW